MLTSLRRAVTVIAASAITIGAGTGLLSATAAFADPVQTSPSPVQADTTQLNWSGQGTPVQQVCSPGDPGAGGYQNGATSGNYELWIFATDGGSVSNPPTLTINGTTYGNAYKPSGGDPTFGFGTGAWQIVTPYIDPASISPQSSAFATFQVASTGNGNWVLTISHGCNAGPPQANKPVVHKTAAGSYVSTQHWTIQKQVDKTEIDTNPSGSATFHYTVTATHTTTTNSNVQVTGDVHVDNNNAAGDTINLSNVTDQLSVGGVPLAGASCSFDQGTPTQLQPGSNDFLYTCTLPDSTDLSQSISNTATFSWGDQNLPGDGAFLAAGSASDSVNPVPFSQSGPTMNDCINVTDTYAGPLGQACSSDANPVTFTYERTISGGDLPTAGSCQTYDNTATIVETNQSDHQSVKVCTGAPLVVSKGATPSFDRTYLWNITKTADKTQLVGPGTVTYGVTVTETGYSDGNYQVHGTIHVSNPNSWEPVQLNSVTDALDNNGNNGTCTLDNSDPSLPLTLASAGSNGDSVDLAYTCTYGQGGPTSLTQQNTATANWDAAAASTDNGSATGSADASFGSTPANRYDQHVTVTDSQAGTLGTADAVDSQPFTSKLFTYQKSFTPPAQGCTTFPNTATFTTNSSGTTGSASQSVKDCQTLGALTMGFWQNKNGQAIITGDSVHGTALYNYLHQFAPFSDLTGTSSSQVAAYFTKVFNAATAAGSGAAMLKAQMLATALDVYFSQTGNNKINAPAPIGGVSVDVTPWASAFGNPSPATMKVSDMLSYASSQWNGGNPYGTSSSPSPKTLVSLAISAFNAVNNSTISEV